MPFICHSRRRQFVAVWPTGLSKCVSEGAKV